jgi:hypothetical protein
MSTMLPYVALWLVFAFFYAFLPNTRVQAIPALIGGVVGGTLALNSYATLWQEMANRKSESGEKLGVMPNTLLAPSQLKATATTLLQAQFIGAPIIGNLTGMVGATENTQRGTSDLLVWTDLSSNAAWYLLDTSRARQRGTDRGRAELDLRAPFGGRTANEVAARPERVAAQLPQPRP